MYFPLSFGKHKTWRVRKLYTFVHNFKAYLDDRCVMNTTFSPSTKKGFRNKLPEACRKNWAEEGRYLAAGIIWMWYTSLPSAALRPVACTPVTSEVITSRVSTVFRSFLLSSAALFRASRTGTRLS